MLTFVHICLVIRCDLKYFAVKIVFYLKEEAFINKFLLFWATTLGSSRSLVLKNVGFVNKSENFKKLLKKLCKTTSNGQIELNFKSKCDHRANPHHPRTFFYKWVTSQTLCFIQKLHWETVQGESNLI